MEILIVLFIIIIAVMINIIIIKYRLCLIESKLNYKIEKYEIDTLNTTDKIIWSYWHDNNLPLLVKLALHTWYKWNPDYLICFITNDTLSYYLDIDKFPKNYQKSSYQRKADIIRLALLEKYEIPSTIRATL